MTAAALAALEFLTVLRIRPAGRTAAGHALARSTYFFPAVGLLLGGLLAGLDRALREILPLPAESAILIAVLVVLTGALHLDGLADTFDGLFGGRDRESRLRIMHDVATGSFGAAAITMALLLQTLALAAIPPGPGRTGALLLAPVSARCAMVFAVVTFPYARASGLGSLMHDAGKVPAGVAGVATIALAVVLFGPQGVLLLAAPIAAAGAISAWSCRAIGGLTGDVYGAICELSFAASLLALAAGAEQSWLEPARVLRP